MNSAAAGIHERQWYITRRWQEYGGEARANLLRIAAVAAFYLVELLNYHGLNLGFLELPPVEGLDRRFHLAITALAVTWTVISLAILLCLTRRIFPASLKFISTACDVLLLTAVLTVADGPRSPLVVGYFLIIALTTLRFNLPLVWFGSAGSIAGYLFLSGYARWFADSRLDLRVPRYYQILFVLALAFTGIILGQAIRRMRTVAEDFASRTSETHGAGP
jgi:hypothetical protein